MLWEAALFLCLVAVGWETALPGCAISLLGGSWLGFVPRRVALFLCPAAAGLKIALPSCAILFASRKISFSGSEIGSEGLGNFFAQAGELMNYQAAVELFQFCFSPSAQHRASHWAISILL